MPYWNPYVSYNMRVRHEGLGYTVRNRALVPKFRSPDLARSINEALENLREARMKVGKQERVKLSLPRREVNSLDYPIKIKRDTILEGPAKLTAAANFNDNVSAGMVELYNPASAYNIGVRDLELDGNRDNNTIGTGIKFWSDNQSYDPINMIVAAIANVRCYYLKEDGISLRNIKHNTTATYGGYSVRDVVCRSVRYGINCEDVVDSWFNNCMMNGAGSMRMHLCHCVICNNMYFGGSGGDWNVYIYGGNSNYISNFVCDECAKNGFYIYQSHRTAFSNGRISDVSTAANNTYDGVSMEGACDYLIFSNLNFFQRSGINDPKYSIEESATSNNNVYDNLTMEDYVTAGLRILGANSLPRSGNAHNIIGSIVYS